MSKLTETERALFVRWICKSGASKAASALKEDAHTMLSVAVGCAKSSTEIRIAKAWRLRVQDLVLASDKLTSRTHQRSQSLTEKVDRVVNALQTQSATSIDEIAKRAGMKLVHGRKAVHHAIWEGRIINAGTARNPRYVVGEKQR